MSILHSEFGRKNLENAGYDDIVLIKGDGGIGYLEMSPYDIGQSVSNLE